MDSVTLTPARYVEDSVQVDGGPTGRSRDSSNTFIGEIDGRFSISEGNVEDYIRVEVC